MGLARVTMGASETTCIVEGIYRLVWFNRVLGRTGNQFFLFALLFTLLVFSPCQGCGYAPNPVATGAGLQP